MDDNKKLDILESLGMSNSQIDNISTLMTNQEKFDLLEDIKPQKGLGLLPFATKVACQSIALDLVEVKPMCGLSDEEIKENKRIEKRFKREKLIKEIKGIDTSELKPDVKETTYPESKLMYLDWVYTGDKDTERDE